MLPTTDARIPTTRLASAGLILFIIDVSFVRLFLVVR
jgi:hypothetical protein